jgi:hypothetical protein
MMVIVPDSLRAAIDAKLDEAIEKCPGAECAREELYQQLLSYFDEHGVIPDFTVASATLSETES